MITMNQIKDGYAVNLRIILMQVEGLTHEDSLVQTPYNINSLNWVLGHIIVGRDRVLKLLGEGPLLADTHKARYETGSDPVVEDGGAVLPLGELIKILDTYHTGQTDLLRQVAGANDQLI